MITLIFSTRNLAEFGGPPWMSFIWGCTLAFVGIMLFRAGLFAYFELDGSRWLVGGLLVVGAFLLSYGCAILISLSGIFQSKEGLFACGLGLNRPRAAAASVGATISAKKNPPRSSPLRSRHGGLRK